MKKKKRLKKADERIAYVTAWWDKHLENAHKAEKMEMEERRIVAGKRAQRSGSEGSRWRIKH